MHSNGNTVTYAYDSMGRVVTLTPAQGSSYKTEYVYNKNGSVATVKVYAGGGSADTTYTYNTTSGKLTQRNDPVRSSANIRITYGYDAAGRLETETVTHESGGATNLYKTTYAYSYIAAGSGGGREILRTEQTYSGVAKTGERLREAACPLAAKPHSFRAKRLALSAASVAAQFGEKSCHGGRRMADAAEMPALLQEEDAG